MTSASSESPEIPLRRGCFNCRLPTPTRSRKSIFAIAASTLPRNDANSKSSSNRPATSKLPAKSSTSAEIFKLLRRICTMDLPPLSTDISKSSSPRFFARNFRPDSDTVSFPAILGANSNLFTRKLSSCMCPENVGNASSTSSPSSLRGCANLPLTRVRPPRRRRRRSGASAASISFIHAATSAPFSMRSASASVTFGLPSAMACSTVVALSCSSKG